MKAHQDEEVPREMTSTTKTGGTVLLLPPDAACSIERKMRLGERLGAVVLVVIAEATADDNADIITTVSSATADVFAPNNGISDDYTGSPSYHKRTAAALSSEFAHGEEKGQRRFGGNPQNEDGNKEPRLRDDNGVQRGEKPQRRLQAGGGEKGRSVREQGGGGACPPLTVVVGHEEGKRMLELVRMAHGEGDGSSDGSEQGGGVVTARLAERDDVGKLWRDVVWASDPVNWPKGVRKSAVVLRIYPSADCLCLLYGLAL